MSSHTKEEEEEQLLLVTNLALAMTLVARRALKLKLVQLLRKG